MNSGPALALLSVTALLGACSRNSSMEEASPGVGTPSVAAADTEVANAPPSAVPQPAATAAPKREVSVARFKDDDSLLICMDLSSSASEEEIAKVAQGNAKRLAQSCDSLGRTALTTCVTEKMTTRYYDAKYSDKFMSDCIKSAGRWETNKTPEAELERAQQELDRLQQGSP